MKKYHLMPLLALMLGACSGDDMTNRQEPDNSEEIQSVRNYLNIRIVPAQGIGTRDAAPGNYEDGTASENKISMVRFFFFDAEGNASPVWLNKGSGQDSGESTSTTGNYQSFIDWYVNENDVSNGNASQTVEKVLNATLGIVVPSGVDNPELVLAVLNPTTQIMALGNETTETVNQGTESYSYKFTGVSLDELQEYAADFYTGLHDENFVMSNSVYMTSSTNNGETVKSIVNATPIASNNFLLSLDNVSQEDILTIYVERVLARLDFMLKIDETKMKAVELTNGTFGYKYIGENANEYYVDGSTEPAKIYIQFLGWNVTGTAAQSRLVKTINSSWTDDNIFGNNEIWNTSDYHRSFWALNPPNLENWFGDFNSTNTGSDNYYPATTKEMPADGGIDTETVYLQENANAYETGNVIGAPAGPSYPTKVIIAAQLVNENGDAYDLAEWAYHKYTPDQLLTYLANNVLNNFYKVTTSAGSTTYTKLTPGDLMYTATAPGNAPAEEADYYSYVVLNTKGGQGVGANAQWTMGEGENATSLTIDQVNAQIFDMVNHVRVWNNGYTYYYFDIEHLGTKGKPGFYGVVRNHIYKSTLQSVKGLGTPVYEPGQIIYPEKNEYDESIVSANIQILQWRIVTQNYDLEWP